MTRVQLLTEGATELDQVWGNRPEYYELFLHDYNKALRNLDPVLVELCRLRIAQMVESAFDSSLRYTPAIEAGLTEDKLAELTDYPTSPKFDERERTVLEFTEQWVVQSSGITDDDADRVQQVITPEQFMYLCKALSVMDQFARANSAFCISAATAVPTKLSDFSLRIPTTA